MTSVVRPASKVYRRVVVKPVRTGIGNMAKNLTFPDRLVNNMFQGNWAGMGQETERCLCNTVIGLGGFFDVATRWGVPNPTSRIRAVENCKLLEINASSFQVCTTAA